MRISMALANERLGNRKSELEISGQGCLTDIRDHLRENTMLHARSAPFPPVALRRRGRAESRHLAGIRFAKRRFYNHVVPVRWFRSFVASRYSLPYHGSLGWLQAADNDAK